MSEGNTKYEKGRGGASRSTRFRFRTTYRMCVHRAIQQVRTRVYTSWYSGIGSRALTSLGRSVAAAYATPVADTLCQSTGQHTAKA
eukprot:3941271-Rhodomonas_salina.3